VADHHTADADTTSRSADPILPLTTPLLGGKKTVFAYPRLGQATVRHFAHLMQTGQFTPVIDRRNRQSMGTSLPVSAGARCRGLGSPVQRGG
jgi:hypothetical protein